MAPTAATLLRLWESGAAAAPPDRAPSLLHSLGAVEASVRTDELTVGQCDALLFELRRVMFGELLEVMATCPACQEDLELTVALGDLQPPVLEGPAVPLTVHADGYTLRCRIPRNDDLGALARYGGEATIRDLLERCALETKSPEGLPVDPRELPEAVVQAAVSALAESDPGAHTTLSVSCPCGREWVDELDIRTVMWNDLTEWVGRTLTEVHQLARAYGWSEGEILAMSGWRRRWYLEAAGW
ncbi:MAG: hypothetical protein ABSB59_06100 [Streptosporangiaceae bacterium]|jgi:hypothetical protein